MNTSAFFRDTKKIIFSLVSLFSIIGYGYFVFAAAPNGGYNPGQILDPDCAPGDVDCVVKLQTSGGGTPAGSDNQIQINQSGSFFADSTFQKSDTDFNVGLDHTQQSAVTFTGSGLDDLTVGTYGYGYTEFNGTYSTTYTVTIDGVNVDIIAIESSTISGGVFAVGNTITNGLGGIATVNSVVEAQQFGAPVATYLGVTITAGTFGNGETIDNGSGVTGTGYYSVSDTLTYTDGTTTISNIPTFSGMVLTNDVVIIFSASTGHTLADEWTWGYPSVNQNVLDFSNNDYKFQSVFGTDTFGYQIGDNLLGFGITGSVNTFTNVAGDFGLSGIVNSGELTIGNSIQLVTGEMADSSLKTTGYDLSIRDALGIETLLNLTSNQFSIINDNSTNRNGIEFNTIGTGLLRLGNLFGGNGTSITIDDIAQTINFNNNYSFPFADGTAGQVLGTDGSGQLGWVTVSGGSVSPISIGTSGNTLYSSGLSGTGQGDTSTGNNIFLGINAGNGATDASDSNFLGQSAGQNATNAYGSNFLGYSAGNGATGASSSNFLGPNAGYGATGAWAANFFGENAGYGATGAYNANFLGYGAGNGATGAWAANFFGENAGNGATGSYLGNFFGKLAGYQASNARVSNFIGYGSGYLSTNAQQANFLGWSAGGEAPNASFSNFMGREAGFSADNASGSNFLGAYAGRYADNASGSNFFGNRAGHGATGASNTNFIGTNAGDSATNASLSNFFGYFAGYGAANATNSIFIGQSAGNSDSVNNTGNTDDFSILIGKSTSTGGYSNSIALGGSATNTASNQFMIGSTTRPITSMVLTGDYSGGSCTFAVGGMSCSSDERLKTNIEDLQSSTLDTVINIRTVHYNWNSSSDGPKQVGFIAQDLQQYFPELVSMGQGGYLQVNYAQMTPILVQAIREMNLKITTINDMTTPNTWRDSLIAWFGNVENGIIKFFAGEIETKKLCIADDAGDKTCITKAQLDQLLMNTANGSVIVPSSSPEPAPQDSPSDDSVDPSTDTPVPAADTGDTTVSTPDTSSDPVPSDTESVPDTGESSTATE